MVLPGFQDAHIHAPLAGRNRLRVWLNDLAARQAYLDRIGRGGHTDNCGLTYVDAELLAAAVTELDAPFLPEQALPLPIAFTADSAYVNHDADTIAVGKRADLPGSTATCSLPARDYPPTPASPT
ncbi:hypothetical protein [Micromonospora sp. NBC_00858]|uniref:hypothetical protein n=1 Tax=Micromonospora sp. NBC_00858 TaxID=2975979 RepID=UPI003865896F|nr:hypothetical protein OG990_07025 [Micromonospora sp. NBC_00858]